MQSRQQRTPTQRRSAYLRRDGFVYSYVRGWMDERLANLNQRYKGRKEPITNKTKRWEEKQRGTKNNNGSVETVAAQTQEETLLKNAQTYPRRSLANIHSTNASVYLPIFATTIFSNRTTASFGSCANVRMPLARWSGRINTTSSTATRSATVRRGERCRNDAQRKKQPVREDANPQRQKIHPKQFD